MSHRDEKEEEDGSSRFLSVIIKSRFEQESQYGIASIEFLENRFSSICLLSTLLSLNSSGFDEKSNEGNSWLG